MKSHNKFIPVAVLAGLCILAVAMNNEECNAEPTATTKYTSSSNDQGSKTTFERTKKNGERSSRKGRKGNRQNRKDNEQNGRDKKKRCGKKGSCSK